MWAYEYEAGKFIAGEILGDTLYVYAPTGRGEKWVMNSEGVVLEYSSEPFHKSDEIIAGINDHYGTSFYQEDDIDKDFTIGETIPNWNAYEKIEMSSRMIAFNIQSSSPIYIFGTIENDILHLNVDANEASWVAHYEGDVVDSRGPGVQAKTWIIQEFGDKGISITDVVANIVQYEVGQIVPDWSDYEKIG